MKITSRQLRRVIQEELNRFNQVLKEATEPGDMWVRFREIEKLINDPDNKAKAIFAWTILDRAGSKGLDYKSTMLLIQDYYNNPSTDISGDKMLSQSIQRGQNMWKENLTSEDLDNPKSWGDGWAGAREKYTKEKRDKMSDAQLRKLIELKNSVDRNLKGFVEYWDKMADKIKNTNIT